MNRQLQWELPMIKLLRNDSKSFIVKIFFSETVIECCSVEDFLISLFAIFMNSLALFNNSALVNPSDI